MNKRITSLILCFVMVFAMMATAVPALSAPITSTQLKVIPDKTTASPGDIITYTIVLGPVSDMGTLQMTMDIPSGLTYVSGSGKLSDNLKTKLGFDYLDWTDISLMINGGASAADYESATDTELAKFQCKVEDGATGTLEVGLDNLEFYSCQSWEDHTSRYSVVSTAVTITAAPKPATDIKLNKNTLELTVGESQTLVATVEPADTTDTVTWDTGRSDIATVDSTGKVTAVAPGTAVIAARAGEKSAFCTVKVVAAPCTHTHKTYIGEKPSTCTKQGWDAYSRCDNCGQRFDMEGNPISEIPYRPLADHKYTANEKKPEALKTAGTCKDKAIYLRSCEVCGKVAPSEAWGSFFGDLDPNNHAGSTTTVNASEPDHKNQVAGYTGDTKCLGCNEIIAYGTSIPAGAHTLKTTVTKATTSKNGSKVTKCTVCGTQTAKSTIYYPKTATLSATKYTYDGKAKKPTVTVKDSKGNKISSSNYTVKYSNNTKVGKATVKITFKGNYSGTVTKTFKIVPKTTSISSLTAVSKGFTAKWKKQATQTTGYQIQIATDSKFTKGVKNYTVSKNSTVSKKITKLTGKKKYYVRIRTYKTVSGTKYYSSWSAKKYVTTKK